MTAVPADRSQHPRSAVESARPRREVAWGALVCLAFAIVFAWAPITSLGRAIWSPADISQAYSLTSVEPGRHPSNELMSDVYVQMHAWVQFQSDRIHAGHLPLWNPWNGNGAPLLGNYQSAVLSPFQVPYYVLPFDWAAVLAGVAKVFCASFFTFLFLRELRLAFTAAIAGGIVFAYAAYNTLLIGYPHSGVSVLLPAVLFLIERVVRGSIAEWDGSIGTANTTAETVAREGGASWRAARPLALGALVLALVALQFGGHPETLYFALAFVTVYSAARVLAPWYDARALETGERRARRRAIAALAAQLLACGLVAAGIGALQTVPFFEYLQSSAMLGHRSARQTPLGLFSWPTLLFPNLLGNPSNVYYLSANFPRPDYTIATMVYVGATATLAALTGFLFVRRRRATAFFAFALLAWFVYAYDLFGSGALWSRIPTLSLAPINRSQFVAAFCIAVLAAFTLHHLLDARRRPKPWVAAFVIVLGIGGLLLARERADDVVELARKYLQKSDQRDHLALGSARHVAAMTWTILAGVALLSVPWLLPSAWLRRAAVWGFVLVAFAQSGWLHKGYMPLCEPRFFYPMTPAMQDLRRIASDRTPLVLGEETVIPCTNVVHGLRQIANYDALGVRRHERLYFEHFGRSNNWMLAPRATTKALVLFGVGAVLDADGWVDVDTAFAFVERNAKAVFETRPLTPGVEVVQEFTGVEDGLDALLVRCRTAGDVVEGRLELKLEDASTNALLATNSIDVARLRKDADGAYAVPARFDPIPDSRHRSLRLRVTASPTFVCRGATSKDSTPPVLLMRQDWRDWIEQAIGRVERRPVEESRGHPDAQRWKLETNGELEDGQLYLDLGFADHRLARSSSVGRFTAYDLVDSPGRFHVVSNARTVADEASAWTAVNARDFDPRREVVLEGVDVALAASATQDPTRAPRTVQIVSEEPERVRLHVSAGDAGWLVLTQTWYPGWFARVAGREVVIERANYAFGAVPVGAEACDVELVYDPPSFRFASWLALTSAVLFASWIVLSRRSSP